MRLHRRPSELLPGPVAVSKKGGRHLDELPIKAEIEKLAQEITTLRHKGFAPWHPEVMRMVLNLDRLVVQYLLAVQPSKEEWPCPPDPTSGTTT